MLSSSVEKPQGLNFRCGLWNGFFLKCCRQFRDRTLFGRWMSPHAAEYARSLGGIEVQQVDFHSVEHAECDVVTFNRIEHLS